MMPSNKLVAFKDGRLGCWSRVELANGDPIWISVAQTGIVVKRSRLGMFGATLFNEKNVYRVARTAQQLDAGTSGYSTPAGMQNAILKAFTQSVLDCRNSAEVAIRLNEALMAHADAG